MHKSFEDLTESNREKLKEKKQKVRLIWYVSNQSTTTDHVENGKRKPSKSKERKNPDKGRRK